MAQLQDVWPHVWDRQLFHAVRVAIKVKGCSENAPEYVAGDTDAAPSLFPASGLTVEVQRNSIQPGRARLMHSASTHDIASRGGGMLQFTLGGQCAKEFSHECQTTEGSGTPAILGVDFWQKLNAVFDFGSRLITLTMRDGTQEQMNFTICDERAKEEVMQVYCVEDAVVPPRAAYLLKGSVGTGAQKVKLTLHDMWMVEARSNLGGGGAGVRVSARGGSGGCYDESPQPGMCWVKAAY